jgi:hypothetical protein
VQQEARQRQAPHAPQTVEGVVPGAHDPLEVCQHPLIHPVDPLEVCQHPLIHPVSAGPCEVGCDLTVRGGEGDDVAAV